MLEGISRSETCMCITVVSFFFFITIFSKSFKNGRMNIGIRYIIKISSYYYRSIIMTIYKFSYSFCLSGTYFCGFIYFSYESMGSRTNRILILLISMYNSAELATLFHRKAHNLEMSIYNYYFLAIYFQPKSTTRIFL